MIATLVALSLYLVGAPAAPVDVFGATVPVADIDLLLVAPADRDDMREKLPVVRKHRLSPAGGAPPRPLVIVFDISDVPSFFREKAKGKIKERATEIAKQQPKGAPPVRFIADQDGSVSRAFRGTHKGSCLITIDSGGKSVRGITVDEIVARAQQSHH